MTKYIDRYYLNGEVYGIKFGGGGGGGWTVDNDTISYLPLQGDLTDLVGNYTWTSGANLQWDNAVADIPVAYMTYDNGYAYTTDNGPTLNGSNSYSVSGWVKQTSATGAMCLLNSGFTPGSHNGLGFYKFYEYGTYKGYFIMYLGGYSGAQGFEIQYNSNPWTDRHLWTVTYIPGTAKIYLDGSAVSTTSTTLSGTVTPENPMYIGQIRSDGWASPTAYYSDILFTGRELSAQEISDYYDLTKSLYGIS